jgi:hypothetical protein
MPITPLRRREFRVICQAGPTPQHPSVYYVDRVMFDDATSEVRCWRGSTPFGYTLEQFRLDAAEYLAALGRKFIFFPNDIMLDSFSQRVVAVNAAYENQEIRAASTSDRGYDYRVGLDALGRYVVYRCFPGNGAEDFSRIEAATATASSEIEVAREVLFLCGAIHRPMIEASRIRGFDSEISGFVPEELPGGET